MSKRVLMLVENLPVPFDRRVWMEATALKEAGYEVSVICPRGEFPKLFDFLEGIRIYRYPLPSMPGVLGHIFEYGIAIPTTFLITCWLYLKYGFDAIHSANPPDFFFAIAAVFKPFGVKFIFD